MPLKIYCVIQLPYPGQYHFTKNLSQKSALILINLDALSTKVRLHFYFIILLAELLLFRVLINHPAFI